MELVWMLVFSLVLMVTLRKYLSIPWLSALAPAACIGVYYAAVTEQELTQLEFLAGLPTYISLWFVKLALDNPKRLVFYFFLSGLFAGLTVVFKLALGLLFAVFWMISAVYALKRCKYSKVKIVFKMCLPTLLGVLFPILTIALFFLHKGALQEFLWTSFVYPNEVFKSAPTASKTRLVTATAFYLNYFIPWIIFALFAVYDYFKNRTDVLPVMLIGWWVVAVILFYVQDFSWWHYHTLVFFVPTGILAVIGIDRFLTLISGLNETIKLLAQLGSSTYQNSWMMY